MRVSKDQTAANRTALIEAAGELFRAKGVDGVGVAEVARAAGLTHGALYAHFPSKDALAADALAAGLDRCHAMMVAAGGDEPTLAGYLDYLLSPEMRDALGDGCPMTASASEIARQSAEVSDRFAGGVARMVATIEAALDQARSAGERRRTAITAVAAEIGAIAIARAVAKSDPTLSEEILEAVRTETARLDR